MRLEKKLVPLYSACNRKPPTRKSALRAKLFEGETLVEA
jgi:hypothetical protein